SASNSGKAGKLKVVGVSNAAIVMSKPDRNNSSSLGTDNKGSTLPLNGSVRGKNSSSGCWEVRDKGTLGCIAGNCGRQVANRAVTMSRLLLLHVDHLHHSLKSSLTPQPFLTIFSFFHLCNWKAYSDLSPTY